MYTVVFSTGTQTKNGLQKAVQSYFKSLDRLMVRDEDLPRFEKMVLEHIAHLRETKFPRCKPEDGKFWSPHRISGYETDPRYFDRHSMSFPYADLRLYYSETAFVPELFNPQTP